MVLNNLPQMFSFYFPSNFWYDEVVQTWTPMVQRMRLPYESVADFMNDQVQGVVFPAMNLDLSTQQRGQYEVAYYGGKELEPLIDKNLKLTMKLTESYLSYWIFWHQMDVFLHYVNYLCKMECIKKHSCSHILVLRKKKSTVCGISQCIIYVES